MELATEAIVIHSVKYSDNSLIVKLLSPGGLQSYMARGVQSRASKTPASVFSPLALLHIEASLKKQGNSISILKSAAFAEPLYRSYARPARQAILMFYAEVSYEVLKHDHHQEYAEIYDFLKESILELEHSEELPPALPLLFMLRMARLLGVGMLSEMPYEEPCFHLGEARFIHYAAAMPEMLVQGRCARLLGDMLSDDRCPEGYTREERNELLRKLILYFQLHFHAGFRVQSHEILSMVLGA